MINFLHTYNPEPIIFSLGPIDIHWYGMFILVGILAAIFIASKLGSYYGVKHDTIMDLAFWLVLGGILGARIYHVFLELPYYLEHPLNIFKIWQGGLAIHGGIIAGVIIIYFYAKKHKISPWLLASLLAPGLALAQAIGRFGNYFNQELFGLPTDLPWGIPISEVNRPFEYINNQFFHPTFIYESLGNLIIFIILIFIHIKIIKKSKSADNNSLHITHYTLPAISYSILYSILRFSLEFIRIDETPKLLGLRFPQIASIIIIAGATILLLKNKKKYDSI